MFSWQAWICLPRSIILLVASGPGASVGPVCGRRPAAAAVTVDYLPLFDSLSISLSESR
jgi:hypothetical protein